VRSFWAAVGLDVPFVSMITNSNPLPLLCQIGKSYLYLAPEAVEVVCKSVEEADMARWNLNSRSAPHARTRYKRVNRFANAYVCQHSRYLTTAFPLFAAQTLVARPAPRHSSLHTCSGVAPSGRSSPVVCPVAVTSAPLWYLDLCRFVGPLADFTALSPVFPRKWAGLDVCDEV